MYKVQWDTESDVRKHCFAVCNYESAISLYRNLCLGGCPDRGRAINVRMFDLSGNEINTVLDAASSGEFTHS